MCSESFRFSNHEGFPSLPHLRPAFFAVHQQCRLLNHFLSVHYGSVDLGLASLASQLNTDSSGLHHQSIAMALSFNVNFLKIPSLLSFTARRCAWSTSLSPFSQALVLIVRCFAPSSPQLVGLFSACVHFFSSYPVYTQIMVRLVPIALFIRYIHT